MLRGVKVPPIDTGREILSENDDVATILGIYTDALERIKDYTTDPKSVVQAATLRVIRIVSSWSE